MLCLKSELDWASLTYYLCSQSLTHVLIISVCAMTFRCCAHNLAFSGIQVDWVRSLNKTCSGPTRSMKGAPWAVGSATRAWNFCGVHSVTKVENLWSTLSLYFGIFHEIGGAYTDNWPIVIAATEFGCKSDAWEWIRLALIALLLGDRDVLNISFSALTKQRMNRILKINSADPSLPGKWKL